MAADFEAEIKNSLRSLAAQVTALGGVVNSSEAKVSKLGDSLKRAFKQGTDSLPGAKAKVDALGQSIQKAGQAAQRMGGPLGEIVGRLTGGAGMSGGLATAAVAAGVLGIAMKAGTAVIDERIRATQRLITATKELAAVKEAADKTVRAQGLSAVEAQGKSLQLLNTRGGPEAIKEANELVKKGEAPAADVRAAVAESYLRRSAPVSETQRKAALKAGGLVSSSAEGSMADAVKTILSSPLLLNKLKDGSAGNVSEVAARVIVGNRGQLATDGNVAQANADLIKNNASIKFFGAPPLPKMISDIRTVTGINNRLDEVGQNAIASAELPAREALAAAASPETAGMLKLFAQQQQGDAELRELIKAQGAIMKDIKNIGMLIGASDGSYAQQLRKKQIAEAAASFGNGEK